MALSFPFLCFGLKWVLLNIAVKMASCDMVFAFPLPLSSPPPTPPPPPEDVWLWLIFDGQLELCRRMLTDAFNYLVLLQKNFQMPTVTTQLHHSRQ